MSKHLAFPLGLGHGPGGYMQCRELFICACPADANAQLVSLHVRADGITGYGCHAATALLATAAMPQRYRGREFTFHAPGAAWLVRGLSTPFPESTRMPRMRLQICVARKCAFAFSLAASDPESGGTRGSRGATAMLRMYRGRESSSALRVRLGLSAACQLLPISHSNSSNAATQLFAGYSVYSGRVIQRAAQKKKTPSSTKRRYSHPGKSIYTSFPTLSQNSGVDITIYQDLRAHFKTKAKHPPCLTKSLMPPKIVAQNMGAPTWANFGQGPS
ncbi:hypothetical protein DFH06DRAFT_1132489 [Mycena polygramma]|nr:hypothetical protein DFH06DRAFT_1132489 [Mycena polygramma]